MEGSNHTVTEFILLGFTTDPVMQMVLFGVFLGVYSLTLLGNSTLIVLICNDSRLHTPMYFFIGNLSFLDLFNFCKDNIIDDFFCDLLPLVKLACGRKDGYQALMYFLLASNVIFPTTLILASYLFIIATVSRIRSTQGRLKAFSTCSSHLISVTLYYSSILYIYSRPRSGYSFESDKIVSTFYTVVFPLLNPMIYSLRNKDVKEALNKLLK
ncbi:olfactory receptor 1013-like [Otolemur garnettii]|uniref:olfactory receptor 1013-like n=1 Tax=Otolemur garnettii TaxID=30611 RepID=UPI00027428C7|nr:olfactory receptor 1013-like [Otolemur garnettii]